MAIRCVVVTPEKTEVDRKATSLTLPMYDGELGILPGRAPLIGRLGHGLLKLQTETGPQNYYVDGGFAQVEDDVVSVLTSRATPAEQLSVAEAESALARALEMPGQTPELNTLRQAEVMRARGRLRAARNPR